MTSTYLLNKRKIGTGINFAMDYAAPLSPAKRTVHPSWTASIAFFFGGFFFSIWYLDVYYLGDVLAYSRFYYALYRAPFNYWEFLQNFHLGSAEPFYRWLVGPAGYYDVDRVWFISFWNGILVASIYFALVKYNCSVLFSVFMLSNYYLLVLLGPAERLKFAYICLIIGYNLDSVRSRLILSIASIFFHTQALVQFGSAAGYWMASNFGRALRTPLRTLIIGVLTGLAIGAVLYFFYEAVGRSISDKSVVYSGTSGGIAEAIQWAMLATAGALVFRDRIPFLVGMAPMGVLTILFGNRVNVATLVFFAILAMTQGKTRHPIVLAVMAYMSVKSVPFMIDVIETGSGY